MFVSLGALFVRCVRTCLCGGGGPAAMETDMDVTTEQPLSHTDKYSLDSNVFAPADLGSASTVKMDDVEAANNKHRLELISASTAKIEGIEMLEDLAAQSIQRLQLVWTDVSHIVQVRARAPRLSLGRRGHRRVPDRFLEMRRAVGYPNFPRRAPPRSK